MTRAMPDAYVPRRLRKRGWTGAEMRMMTRVAMLWRRRLRFSLSVKVSPDDAPTMLVDHPNIEHIDLGGEGGEG